MELEKQIMEKVVDFIRKNAEPIYIKGENGEVSFLGEYKITDDLLNHAKHLK